MTHQRYWKGLLIVALAFCLVGTNLPRLQAIVINDLAGVQTSQFIGSLSLFDAVAELSMGCTGTLVSPNIVLTAKHCTVGVPATSVTVDFGNNSNNPVFTSNVIAKFEAPGSSFNLLNGTDVALLFLGTDVPSSVAAPMAVSAAVPTGVTAVTIGYGLNGVGSSGHQNTADGLRWAGTNVIDVYGPAIDEFGPIGFSQNIFSTDFDSISGQHNILGPYGSSAVPRFLEATTAPGDSGGPLIVFQQGTPTVIGVLSGGTSPTSRYGDISWWTGLAPYLSGTESSTSWIWDEKTAIDLNQPADMAGFAAYQRHLAVPEPSTSLLLCLGWMFGLALQRRLHH